MPDGPGRKVTIFVSSPTDVMAERERTARVINRLQSRFREHVTIESIFFEEKYYTADKSFQEQIPDAGAADLVVSIFWSRLGSELPSDLFGTMADGRPYPGGAVYELTRALDAKRQKNVPDILVYRKITDTGISVTDPDQRRLMTGQLDAFEAFWGRWFVSREGHFRAGYQTFNGSDDFERLLEGHLRAWLDEQGLLGKEVIWRIAERGSPFRGLEAYEPQHADVFFGREREVDRGRERLLAAAAGGTAFLLIMGSSGAGKSSLVRAGLITRLTQPGDIDGVDVVRFAIMRPGEAATPQRALADALFRAEALPELVESDFPQPEQLTAALAGVATAATAPILRALDRLAKSLKTEKNYDRPVEARLLLILDQLEELFSEAVTEAARLSFVRLIAALARSGRVHVIATLRSSAYGELAREPELVALKDAGAALDVAVPGAEVLGEIVRRPAAAAGLMFDRRADRSLDEILLAAAGSNADALPLLGFTLQWLFENRDGDRLTISAYDQLGGLDGAIGRAAEQAFQNVDQDAQAALPQLLRGLAETSRSGAGLSLRDLPLASVPEGAPARRLADVLVAARVVLVHGEGALLRLAHEAVLRGWQRAHDITSKEHDFYRIREDVATAEQRWRSKNRSDLLLAPGLPLAEAQSLRATYGAELDPALVAFVDASIRKEQRRLRRGYALAAIFGVVAIAAIATGVFAWRQQQIAARNFDLAVNQADGLVSKISDELNDLTGVSRDIIRRIMGVIEKQFDEIAKIEATHPRLMLSRARMERVFVDNYVALGDNAIAARRAKDCVDIARQLVLNFPDDLEMRRSLGGCLHGQGDVERTRGNFNGAVEAYRDSIAAKRRVASKDQTNLTWQFELADVLLWYGFALNELGRADEALAALQESLGIAERLVALEPENATWQLHYMRSLNVRSLILTYIDKNEEALIGYQKAQEIARRLFLMEQGNTKRQSVLSNVLLNAGVVLVKLGRYEEALTAFKEGIDLKRRLVASDPGNAQWRKDLSVILYRIGGALAARNDSAGALAVYREGLGIARELTAKDPGSKELQMEIALLLDALARAGDDPRTRWSEALVIVTQLRRQDWIGWIEGELAKLTQENRP